MALSQLLHYGMHIDSINQVTIHQTRGNLLSSEYARTLSGQSKEKIHLLETGQITRSNLKICSHVIKLEIFSFKRKQSTGTVTLFWIHEELLKHIRLKSKNHFRSIKDNTNS